MIYVTATPNMNLQIPVVGTEGSPQWAIDVNACFSVVDVHDHSPGYGVQITPAGLNINSDLSLGSNNLTNARTLRLALQSSTPSGSADLGALYESSTGDLYYIDGAGNNVRVTQGGSLAGAAGTITGLPNGTASAAYNSTAGSFIFQKATSTPALLDVGSILIRNNSASSHALTLNAPAAMSSDISQTLPTIPAAQNIMTMDNTGAMAAAWNVDGSTITVSGNVIAVPAGGIGTTQLATGAVTASTIANGTITTTQISSSAGITGGQLSSSANIAGSQLSATAGITNSQRAALGQQGNTVGAFNTTSTSLVNTGLTATITTVGRPVFIGLMSDGSGTGSISLSVTSGSPTLLSGTIAILRDGTIIGSYELTAGGAASGSLIFTTPLSSVWMIDVPTSASHVYTIQVRNFTTNQSFSMANAQLFVYGL